MSSEFAIFFIEYYLYKRIYYIISFCFYLRDLTSQCTELPNLVVIRLQRGFFFGINYIYSNKHN